MTALCWSAAVTQMQGILDVAEPTQRTTYRVGGQSIVVEAQDNWAAKVISELFAGWYLTPAADAQGASEAARVDLAITSNLPPPLPPNDWQQFEIAGAGQCYTDGSTSYVHIAGSIVAIGKPGKAAVEVCLSGELPIQSPVLTRVVTYALSAALRRRRLFELHSGALVQPDNGQGVLIIGPSGSGKSTLTVQLATAGWPFLTDDVLLLGDDGAQIKAWPLRRCFAITSETFAASDFLQTRTVLDYVDGQRDDKKQFTPHGVFGSDFRADCVPRTLFFTAIAGSDCSQIAPLSRGETMARLIRMNPWSCYDRTTAADHLAVLSSLARQTTAYSLLAGRDLLDPKTAADLITSHTRD